MITWKEYSKSKIIDPSQLEEKLTQLKNQGKTIATLNGSFDLLHAGHLYMIYEAKKTADILLVALNSDESVRSYKGESRPICPLEIRLEMMSAIAFVDYLTWFDETDPRELILKVKPHVHVNGAEYGENCIEAKAVAHVGARLHLVDRVGGFSTSHLLERIAACV